MSDAEIIENSFKKCRTKSIEDKRVGFEKYSKYFDNLKDACARYPYSIIMNNPPDNNAMYFRKMNFNEFCNNDLILSEFCN